MASSPATAPPPESKSPSTNSTSPPTSESSTPPPVLAPPPSSPPPFSPPPPFPPPSSPPPSSSPPLHFSPPPPASSPPPPPPVSTPPPQFSSPPPPDPPLPAPIFLSPPVPPSPKGSGTPPSPTLPPPSLSPPTPPSSSGSTPPSPTLPPPSPPSSTPPSSFKPPPSSNDLLPPPPPKRPASAPPRSLAPPTNNNNANSNKSSSGSDVNLPMVAGIAAGIALFFLIIGIAACVCYRKKKKKPRNPTNYHPDAGVKGNDYYNRGAAPPKRNNGGQDALAKLPPPPGMARNASSSSPPSINNESSVNYSGPNGPAVQSSSPSITLGFIKSTFSYEELATATNGFSEENILGQGGFGYVHKGILPNGQEVAVKQLKAGSGQGEREFQAEVEIISRVHHRHLVSLIGYCIVGSQRLLVYEFLPNKTLEFHLHGKNQPTMDWPTRMKIALGSAKGLAYLHEDCHPRIIHRDIKASNILLDYRFEAKVADFGLAKLSSDNYTHISTRVMGTFGYLAPEYASSGKLSEKSDVFSFGVMLLELITGKRPIHNNPMEDSLVDWARPLLTHALADENYDELVDPKLEGSYTKMEMTRMVACAATSVRHSAKMRPKMSQIVRALEGDSSLEDLTDGVKPGQSMLFTSSSEHESGSYASNMNRFRRAAFDSNELSQEYSGLTSDYGLNPSSSSSSGEISTVRYASSRQSGSQQ